MVVRQAAVVAAGLGALAVPALAGADPGARVLRRDYLHSEVTFRGRAVDGLGRALSRAPVSVVSSALDGVGSVTVASTVADARGWWRITAPKGPPRVLSVFAAGVKVRVVRERVAPSVWMRIRSLPRGRLVFHGREWGPPTIVVVKRRTQTGGWSTFAVHHTSPAGLFVVRMRAPRALAGRRVTLRATTWPAGAWRSGASRPQRVWIH